MSFRVEFQKDALIEADEASDFLDSRRAGLGDEFLDELERGLALIAEFHRSAQRVEEVRESETRRLVLPRFSYIVVYAVETERLFVIAVAHTSRLPGYWAGRK